MPSAPSPGASGRGGGAWRAVSRRRALHRHRRRNRPGVGDLQARSAWAPGRVAGTDTYGTTALLPGPSSSEPEPAGLRASLEEKRSGKPRKQRSFRKGSLWAGCHGLGPGRGSGPRLFSASTLSNREKRNQGSPCDDTGQGFRHRCGLRRQVGQGEDRRTTAASTGVQGHARSLW